MDDVLDFPDYRIRIDQIVNLFKKSLPDKVKVALAVDHGEIIGGTKKGKWHIFETSNGRIQNSVRLRVPTCDVPESTKLHLAGVCDFAAAAPTVCAESARSFDIPLTHCPKFTFHMFADWSGVGGGRYLHYSTGEAWVNIRGKLSPINRWSKGRRGGGKAFVGDKLSGEYRWKATKYYPGSQAPCEKCCPKDAVLQEQVGEGPFLPDQMHLRIQFDSKKLPSVNSDKGFRESLKAVEEGPVRISLHLYTDQVEFREIQSSFKDCYPGTEPIHRDQVKKSGFGFTAYDITSPSYLGEKHYSWTMHLGVFGKVGLSPTIIERDWQLQYRWGSAPKSIQDRPHNIRLKAQWCIGGRCGLGSTKDEAPQTGTGDGSSEATLK